MHNPRHRKSVKYTAIIFVLLIAVLTLEGMARLVFAYQDELSGSLVFSNLARGQLVMDPYEIESPSIGGHWGLRPGYPTNSTNNPFRINKNGMRGPDIDEKHSRLRILSLGDSVTFGLADATYPRILENVLNGAGLSVEVINGGVEGYSPRNLLYEIDRYLSLRPEVVTIFIGWNALYSSTYWLEKHERISRLLWFIRNISRSLKRQLLGEEAYATEMLARPPELDASNDDVIYAAGYSAPFLGQIEELVDRLQKGGSKVFLITLPGLFVSDEQPTARALKIGHLPAYSVNPYVLAKITQRYNQSLRDLALRKGLGLIDIADWSKIHLTPRDKFFSDSVHLTGEGLRKISGVITEHIKKFIGKEGLQ